jgi:cytochrome P450
MAEELIADIAPLGECEFIGDFAKKMPIGIFLKIVDLPYADREMLLSVSEASSRSRDLSKAHKAQAQMKSYLEGWVNKRRVDPGEDLISQVVHAKIDGQTLSIDDVLNLLTVVLFGGLDTVTSMLGFICRFLAQNPDHRRLLCDHPEVREAALEELIRRHGIVNTARFITGDFVFRGVRLKEGDLIQIPNLLYGLDARINADPLKVDFTRCPIRHVAFGSGPHACPGAFLARREVAAFIDAWLEKIPEFAMKPGTAPKMAPGPVNGVAELFLCWTRATN